MATYKLLVVNGSSETILEFTEKIANVSWKCVDGDAVWGIPSSGQTLGSIMTSPMIQLSPLADYLEVVNLSEKGKNGIGEHVDINGGSFPAGTFDWTVLK